MIISYEYVDCIFLKNELKEFKDVFKNKPIITFKNYVKSQLHYDILVHRYNRDITSYNQAYNCICGRTSNFSAYKQVLKYYYSDLSDLIFSIDPNFDEDFSILGNIDMPRFDEIGFVELDIDKISRDLARALREENVENSDVDINGLLRLLPTNLIGFKQQRLLTEALLMRYYAGRDPRCLKWR